MLSRGYDLLKEISSEKDKWGNYITQIDKKLACNYGDSILSAACIVYMSVHDYETRTILKERVKKLCEGN